MPKLHKSRHFVTVLILRYLQWLQSLLSEKMIIRFVWLTLFVGACLAFYRGQWETLFIICITLFFTCVPFLLHRWYAVKLPKVISLFGVLFAYFSLFLGEIHDFYERFWWWDILLHSGSAMVFGLVGLGIMRMMQSAQTVSASASVVSIFGLAFALAIGAVWEIVEFLIDRGFGTHMQKSLQDTMGDLMIDALGALIVSVFGYFHWKYGRKNLIGDTVEYFIKRYQNRLTKTIDR